MWPTATCSRVSPGNGSPAGQALIEHACQRVDVGTGLDLSGVEALGGHVGPRADGGVGRCQRGVAGGAGDAEVDEIGEVVLGQQDVGRFDVAVHQSGLVGAVQCRGDLFDDVHGAFGWHRAVVEQGLQVVARDQSHGHVQASFDFSDVVDRHDMGVVEACGGACFAAEALVELGVLGVVGQQHLQRHHPVDFGVVRPPHLTHAAAPEQLDQLVSAKWGALHRLTITTNRTLCRGDRVKDGPDCHSSPTTRGRAL